MDGLLMAKRQSSAAKAGARSTNLFSRLTQRRRRPLFLQRYLAEEADKPRFRQTSQGQPFQIIEKWAELEAQGHLLRKETALDADFLIDVFGKALGYRQATDSPEKYELERNFTVPDVGTADGALGNFSPAAARLPLVVIELKSADVDLDRDRFNGRTPVQQCWDYLNAFPDCPWGIVSNFVTFRLYHRDKTPQAWEEFTLKELRDPKRFAQFYYVFEVGGLARSVLGEPPRAVRLLEKSSQRQLAVSDILYEEYRANRFRLIEHLVNQAGKPLETAIHVAQKILDRIVFVAFCEDRGLLPARCIDTAYRNVPPFSKVTNPRWRNFLDLFEAIDGGHASLALDRGYNGGLFRRDPDVDDLQLDDEWTRFFQNIGGYDFRDEVTVDVLGHIFERSIAELEALRRGGLYGLDAPERGGEPAMPKSAERKRFGIYYTPPEFTGFLVRETVHAVIDRRLAALRALHGLPAVATEDFSPGSLPRATDERSPALAAFWRDALNAVRQVKICDPACGSGAFLIQAYDALEERYTYLLDQLSHHDGEDAAELATQIAEMILADNLHGVDLSAQAVEITQLALWIRSAQRGRTLADLSQNIVCRNSLVGDAEIDARAIDWPSVFPAVFSRGEQAGFDCVIGNPPWERLKLQEREFFAFAAPAIAGAVSAAARRKMIAELEKTRPELYNRYLDAGREADRTLAHVRASGNFPLTAAGDINTYMLFAELARTIVAPAGRVGLLVPSGICTDHTTRDFFNTLIDAKSLVSLYDFENRKRVFPDVDSRFKFCALVFEGAATAHKSADFAFFCHAMEDLDQKSRHIKLTAADIALMNPNTRTCPIFRTRRDAKLTKQIYKTVPVLVDKPRRSGGNPWGLRFLRMFDQTNDAELFHTREQLVELGLKQEGNRWTNGKRTFLPLYEAKMVQAYDHRAASVVLASRNWVRQGQREETSLVSHQNPEFVVQPRWWVEDVDVDTRIGGARPGYLCYKDVTSPTNQRTMIAAIVPHVALVNSAPLLLTGEEISPRIVCCLLANLNSLAYDFVARQKVGGVHLNFFIVNQLPTFPPERYAERCPWAKRQTLEKWISDRVLTLTCTADDMRPFADAAGFAAGVQRWIPAERADLLAELDAAYCHLYGLARDDVEYLLTTFQAHGPDAAAPDLFFRGTPILEAYDRLAQA